MGLRFRTPHPLSIEIGASDKDKEGLAPGVECPAFTSQSAPLAMLVPARGSAPLRGCSRKSLTNSSLRASSGHARKARNGLSGLLYETVVHSASACGAARQVFHLAGSKVS